MRSHGWTTRGGRLRAGVCAGLLGGAVVTALAACHHDLPLPRDPFSTRSVAPLSLSLADAADAQRQAAVDIERALAALDLPPPADMTPVERAEISRTLVRRTESRVQAASTQVERADARGRDVVNRLRGDLREFEDENLYRASKERYNAVRDAFDDAIGALKSARGTFAPCVTAIRDRQLFDQAHADEAALTARPATAGHEPEHLLAMRRAVDAAAEKVRRSIAVFRGVEPAASKVP